MQTSNKCIDIMKMIAAIAVVAIHSHPLANTDYDYIATCLCRFAVPFFFVVSSYFFFSNHRKSISAWTKRLSLLYVIWFVLETPYIVNHYFFGTERPLLLSFARFFIDLVFNNTFMASWYIMALVQSVLIVYYLDKRISRSVMLMVVGGGGI